MSIRIEALEGEEAATEFVLFHDRVYAERSARWAAPAGLQVPFLTGESPFAKERLIRAFVAREQELEHVGEDADPEQHADSHGDEDL